MANAETAAVAAIVGLQLSDGGVPKRPVNSALVTPLGLMGDKQRNRRFHGGPDRALCLYSIDRIGALNREGHALYPGSTGENVTIRGLDWDSVKPGKRYRLGKSVEIEITSYTTPCHNIAESFAGHDFGRIHQKTHPGYSRVYARVSSEGDLIVGDQIVEITEEGIEEAGDD